MNRVAAGVVPVSICLLFTSSHSLYSSSFYDFFCFRFLSFSYYWIIKGITVHLVDCSTLPKVVDKLFDVEVSKFGPAARNGIKCNKIISINATRSGWFV